MDQSHISKLDISLDNKKLHYLAGDKVSGLLRLTILGPESAPYPHIGLVCVAESKWVESAGTYFHCEGQEYKDQRTCIDLVYKMPEQCLGGWQHFLSLHWRWKGDTIAVHCTVENHSTLDATPRVTLFETQVYMCGERHKSLQAAIAGPVMGNKVSQETCDTQCVFVTIPTTASLSIRSWIVSVKYMIHVTLDIPYAHDLHINLPVVVVNKETLLELDRHIFNSSK
ncbi:unnamed protein product [Oppiella nova]|uniref:Arrestin C-terminal-like domain-containing protein n=1 Tax=Oppiella nova TaxID=334625 RepID=A0A7R9LUV3_9ACAR|nr:unnamed protein product [Oppiella nova]CAG2166462.1 unnamed protein product [Oppiella nova]